MFDLLHQCFIFCFEFLSFQTCQGTQSHVYDRLRLYICQSETLHQF